jgi:hypothetical protein
MPNTFITPTVIARAALANLYNTLSLGALVFRDYDTDFNGKVGSSVSVKTPPVFEAQEYVRANGITLQDATETYINVTLDTILDVSFEVTSEEMTLEIVDFENTLLMPAMEAIAQGIEARLAEQLITQARAHTPDYLADGTANPDAAFREARAKLSRNKLPFTQRYALLSPEAVSDILGDSLFVTANESGSTQGLREATVGRAFGFDTYESQVLGDGAGLRGEADGVAFHRDAVALVSRTLALPSGAKGAAIASYKGLGVRVVYDYDMDRKSDVVSVDTLIGVQDIRSNAAVELEFGNGS